MSNYTPTGTPPASTRAASSPQRNEFTSIAAAIATKGDLAGQVWLGNHDFTGGSVKVPTLAYGSTGNYAVSFDALNAYILTANLPGQGGNAGRFLTTNGVTASWAVSITPSVIRVPRTSNTILDASNLQNLIDITSGTFTQTFTAAATLGSGWFCYLRNSGSGEITIPASDGVTNWKMYPGECRLFQCDGSTFNSIVLTPFSTTFTTTSTFTRPPGYQYFGGLLWGGGGSGGRSGSTDGAGGAGGGACLPFTLSAAAMGTSQTVTIAAGGAGVTTAAAGNVGGNSSIGTLAIAYGGGGGGYSATNSAGGGGGGGCLGAGTSGGSGSGAGGIPRYFVASAGTFDDSGFGGGYGGNPNITKGGNAAYGGAGGASSVTVGAGDAIFGGAGGGGVTGTTGALVSAGLSRNGGNGGAANDSVSGIAGTAPGGGGGATRTGVTSGAGARGECRIWGIV